MKKTAILLSLLLTVVFCSCVFAADNTYQTEYVTRGEFAHELANLLTTKGVRVNELSCAFADVPNGSEYYNDIAFLSALGIIQGCTGNDFQPEKNIIYQDAAVMASRVFANDDEIVTYYGIYPNGFVRFASLKLLLNNVDSTHSRYLTAEHAKNILNNIDKEIPVYDCMKKLNCDTYNGSIYIDYYPKYWQSGSEKPPLPTLSYSYDGVIWNTAYEETLAGYKAYNLPKEIQANSIRFAWEYGAFEAVSTKTGKNIYSYDYTTWQDEPNAIEDWWGYADQIPYSVGIFRGDKYTVVGDKCVFHVIRATNTSTIWISKDKKKWIGISVPAGMNYINSFGLNRNAEAFKMECVCDFSESEIEYLDNEEKATRSAGLSYQRPKYKTENYILPFSDVQALLEQAS